MTGALSSTSRLVFLRATSNRYVGGALISMTLFALPESQVQALIEQTPAEPVRAAESQLDGATIPGKVAETAALTPASSATYPAGQGGKSGAIGSERLGYAGSAPASRQDWFIPALSGRFGKSEGENRGGSNLPTDFAASKAEVISPPEPAFTTGKSYGLGPEAVLLSANSAPLVDFELSNDALILASPFSPVRELITQSDGLAVNPSPPVEIALDLSEQLFFDAVEASVAPSVGSAIQLAAPAMKMAVATPEVPATQSGTDLLTTSLPSGQSSVLADTDANVVFVESAPGIGMTTGQLGLETVSLEPAIASSNMSSTVLALQAAGGGAPNSGPGRGSGWRLLAEGSGGYDTNPFFGVFEDAETPTLRLRVKPEFTSSSGRTDFRLSGGIEWIEYLENFDTIRNYDANARIRHKASERLELTGGLNFFSRILGAGFGTNSVEVEEPTLAPDDEDFVEDPTVFGLRQRRNTFIGSGGLIFTPSERDVVEIGAIARREEFSDNLLNDVTFITQNAQYRRVLSESIQIGAAATYSISEFDSDARSDVETISPTLVLNAQLTPRLQLGANIGAAFVDLEGPTETTSDTAFSGEVSLCYRDERKNLCATATRGFLPFGIGGVRLQTAVASTYSHRLSERDRFSLRGSYSTIAEPVQGLGTDTDLLSLSGRYDRQISERVDLFFNTTYSDLANNVTADRSRFQILGGVSLRLGAPR